MFSRFLRDCAGAAALMASEFPSLTAADMKASMLSSVTPVAKLQGYSQTGVCQTALLS